MIGFSTRVDRYVESEMSLKYFTYSLSFVRSFHHLQAPCKVPCKVLNLILLLHYWINRYFWTQFRAPNVTARTTGTSLVIREISILGHACFHQHVQFWSYFFEYLMRFLWIPFCEAHLIIPNVISQQYRQYVQWLCTSVDNSTHEPVNIFLKILLDCSTFFCFFSWNKWNRISLQRQKYNPSTTSVLARTTGHKATFRVQL